MLKDQGWVIKDYVRRTFNAESHLPEELKPFADDLEWDGGCLVIYVPRVIYTGKDEEKRGKTERLLPDFLAPWYLYPVEDIQSALDPEKEKPETTADERTIFRWKEKWRAIVGELRRKAAEKERIGEKVCRFSAGIADATDEIKSRIRGRWFSFCYVIVYLSEFSRRTNLPHPLFISSDVFTGEVTSNHGGKTDAESERQT